MTQAKAVLKRCDRPKLTPREIDVAIGLAGGASYADTARGLKLGLENLRMYVERLRDKTGYRLQPQLAIWAVSQLSWLLRQQAAINKKR